MITKSRLLLTSIVLVTSIVLAACSEPLAPMQATGGAELVTELGFQIPKNAQGHTAEQQNIIDRLRVTTDPTKVLWIHLIALDGKIIQRMPVAHKVTSSGKRLEPVTAGSSAEYGADYPVFVGADGKAYETTEFIQPDGTFGSSDNYIFWFDPMHRYHQWGTAGGLGYLLTDYPIDLRNPQDAVSGMFNADLTAYEWQKVQEAQMCLNEGRIYDAEKGVCNDPQ